MSGRPPLYGLRVAATGLALVASGLALLLWMFRTTLGPFVFFEESASHLPTRAALWVAGDKPERDAALTRWRTRLGTDVDLTPLEHPSRLTPERAELVVWDGVELDSDAVDELARFVKAGGSAALLGIRESPGTDGSAFAELAELWGSPPLLRGEPWLWRLEPGASGPLRAGLGLQRAIPLRRAAPLYSLNDARTEVRWGTETERETETIPGAAWREQVGAGRIAWLGVRPDDVLDRSEAHIAMDSLVTALIAWLRRAPFPEIVVGSTHAVERLREVRARLQPAGPRRFELAVSQRGDAETPAFRIRIHLNRAIGGVDISAATAGGVLPAYSFRPGSQLLELDFSALGGGESRVYFLDLSSDTTQTARRRGRS